MILIQTKRAEVETQTEVKLAGDRNDVESELIAAMAAYAMIISEDCDDVDELTDVMTSICAKALRYAKENQMQIRAAGLH